MPTAVIVEDQRLLSEFVAHILGDLTCERVLKATDGELGLELCLRERPDLVVLDLKIPKLSGMTLLGLLRERLPEVPVVVVSAHLTPEIARAVHDAGASGLVSKDILPDALKDALRQILDGAVYYSPEAYRMIRQAKDLRSSELSPRETSVLQLVGEGYSSKEIAEMLCISVRTVETHRANCMRKLNLRGATDMARYAAQTVASEVETV